MERARARERESEGDGGGRESEKERERQRGRARGRPLSAIKFGALAMARRLLQQLLRCQYLYFCTSKQVLLYLMELKLRELPVSFLSFPNSWLAKLSSEFCLL
jgi:hypothetical protein